MINIENLRFGYPKRALLFEDLYLHLTPGNICGLLGRNGAGKSTLLAILQGLLFPKGGNLSVLGFEPQARKPELLSNCFLLTEDLYLPNLSIQAFADLYAPFYPGFDRDQFSILLEEFELESVRAKLPKLSLGQQKKALLAFGLATNAQILLMDEPTNGLDIPSKILFRSVLARYIRDDRLFVLSTHQVRDLQSLLDTVVILEQGKIIFQESLVSIMDQLHFSISYQEPYHADVLYWERVPGGYYTIRSGQGEDSLEPDIEILFNAVIHHPESFNDLFKFQFHAE